MERKKLKYNLHEDLESVYNEIQYAASMVDGLLEFCIKNKDLESDRLAGMRVFVCIQNLNTLMKQAKSQSEQMLWQHKSLYGKT